MLLHICDDTTRLLNRMVEIGADILSLDVQVDMAHAKEIVGRPGIDIGQRGHQPPGPPEPGRDIPGIVPLHRKGRQRAGGYTLSSSCEVPYETPPENIDAMVRAAREFGAEFFAETGGRG